MFLQYLVRYFTRLHVACGYLLFGGVYDAQIARMVCMWNTHRTNRDEAKMYSRLHATYSGAILNQGGKISYIDLLFHRPEFASAYINGQLDTTFGMLRY